MDVGTCSAEMFYNDKFGFLKILDTVRTDSISTPWKFTYYSYVDILEDFTKRFGFYFIKSMSTIDYLFNDELSQGCCFNDMFIADFNGTLI